MEAAHLMIVVPLAVWLGARIGRKVPWSTGRALLALVFVVPLALAVGVPADQVVVDAVCLGAGLLWERRSRSGGGQVHHRRSSGPGNVEPAQAAEFSIGSREQSSVPAGETATIRGQRREEMARLRAQRKGKKSPIF